MRDIFIIAPYFPPSPMPPSQRVRLLVQHASSFGYLPTVFTVDPKYREEQQDLWMNELAGNNYKLVTVNCFHQNNTRKIKIGDLGLRMLPFLLPALYRHIKKQKPSFILYPVPPWYILTIAPVIKWLTGVPYAIDFIDPWVYDLEASEMVFKKKATQWIARRIEKWACERASIIYSVSEGINDNLIKRYPKLKNKSLFAIAYGAEQNDFDLLRDKVMNVVNEKISIRYIGAIWLDCYPVLEGLMPALSEVAGQLPLDIEFIGTSYAGEGLAKPQLDKWIQQNNMQGYTTESPLRITYKKAVELTLQSDLLLLIGGMLPYYAASKLMGLLVSRKPFVAFLHKDSFPAKLLLEIKYPYLVTYSNSGEELPVKNIQLLVHTIKKAIMERKNFKGVDLSHPVIQKNTAFGMTQMFLQPITKSLA